MATLRDSFGPTEEDFDRYWSVLSSIQVTLAPNPIEMGPRYIAEKIYEIRNCTTKLNTLGSEVTKQYHLAKSQVSRFRIELKVRTQLALLQIPTSLDSPKQKEAKASRLADSLYLTEQSKYLFEKSSGNQAQTKEELQEFVLSLPEHARPRTLSHELIYWKNVFENLSAIMQMISAKRKELKEHDAAVRLQHQTIDLEVRAFGIKTPSRLSRRKEIVDHTGEIHDSTTWDSLESNTELPPLIDDDTFEEHIK